MEFKYIAFGAVFLLGVPAGVMLCFLNSKFKHFFLILMMWSTCIPNQFGINFFSREFYRAMSRGIEFTLADICVLVLLFFMLLRSDEYKIRWLPPTSIPYFILIALGFLSWMFADGSMSVPAAAEGIVPYSRFETGLYPVFEISKIIRGCVLYFTIVNLIRTEADMRAIAWGFVCMAGYMSFIAIESRYLHGVHRVGATLGHANSLGTYMAIATTVMFALCLQQRKYLPSLFYGALTIMGGVTVILTISRGGLMMLGMGIWLDFVVFFWRGIKLKNIMVAFGGVLVVAVVLIMAGDTLSHRFLGETDAGEDLAYRQLYNKEARLMAKDYIFGIGPGNFSAGSWNKYAAKVSPDLPPGTPPHNIWYLTLGEMGWPGLLTFIAIWLRLLWIGVPFIFGKRTDIFSMMAAASMLALMVGHIQFALQLSYRQTSIYYMVRLLMGVIAAAWCIRREERRSVRKEIA